MHRFFLPELQPLAGDVVSLRAIHNQLFRVLRVQPGEQVLMLDNAGSERLLEIVSVDRRDTMAHVVKVRTAPAEPSVAVTLYQCILRADMFDLVLQKATELGVTTIVPVVSNRTLTRLGRAMTPKQTRWNAIVREAAEQSGRGGLPIVTTPCSFAEAVANATGARLLPWEEATSKPGLLTALGQAHQPMDRVNILIGPEGGLEADEVKTATAAGWQVVSLGKRILRAETAAIAALSVVSLVLGDLGDSPLAKLPVADQEKGQAKQPEKPPAAAKSDEKEEREAAQREVSEAKRDEAAAQTVTDKPAATEKPAARPKPLTAKVARVKTSSRRGADDKAASAKAPGDKAKVGKRRSGGRNTPKA